MTTPCWCGLPAELHDGRELDANGDLHEFGKPVRPEPRRQVYDDPPADSDQSRPLPVVTPPADRPTRVLLADLQSFLDRRVIGAKCLVPSAVAEARLLNAKIVDILST